jgi:hypothetical protein
MSGNHFFAHSFGQDHGLTDKVLVHLAGHLPEEWKESERSEFMLGVKGACLLVTPTRPPLAPKAAAACMSRIHEKSMSLLRELQAVPPGVWAVIDARAVGSGQAEQPVRLPSLAAEGTRGALVELAAAALRARADVPVARSSKPSDSRALALCILCVNVHRTVIGKDLTTRPADGWFVEFMADLTEPLGMRAGRRVIANAIRAARQAV